MASRRGRPKKRRTRTDHRGVKLLSRKLASGKTVYVARWTDPVTGKLRQESLSSPKGDRPALTTGEARREWAIEKSKKIQDRDATEPGDEEAAPRTDATRAVNAYLDGLTRKAPKTVQLYRQALDHLIAWAEKSGVTSIQEIDPKRLTSLGKYLHGLKAKSSAKGEGIGRGASITTTRLLAPATVNQFIRGIRTFLRHCRLEDLAPNLSSDVIRDRLPFAKNKRELPRFLKAKEVRALLQACRTHDAVMCSATRDGQPRAKYPPIFPFVATCLFTGMRFKEAASLRWADVHLEEGIIELSASATKTGEGRRISLRETPALTEMLKRMEKESRGGVYVFGGDKPLPRDMAESARRRLCAEERQLIGKGRNPHKREPRAEAFGAPKFTWHDLRRTCGTFLTCAPAIYGAASAFLSAKRLGHSVAVAERYYVGAVANIPPMAASLEVAMGCADILAFLAELSNTKA